MKGRILIADEDLQMVKFMEKYLKAEGYHVFTAANGSEAIARAGQGPEIILLNIMLPGIESRELYKAIRKKTQCPVLFFLSKNTVPDKENIFSAFDIKQEDFILKPFSIAELEAKVEARLRWERRKKIQAVRKFSERITLSYLWLARLDKHIFDLFTRKNGSPFIENIMVLATRLGDGGIIWAFFTLICLLSDSYRRFGLVCMASGFTCSFIANILIKKIVSRTRPFLHYWPQITLRISRPPDSSFPSGHTAVSFAAAGILAQINLPFAVLAYTFAGLISFSRLYLLVHYPSDILGGAILGILCGLAFSPLL